ncbi:GNAT family N-acetyltransferase [Candidatus Formimonas warabiya]|uniref:N-acetyltransferase domain-containing protein n=1 Tax=Formimonas warabiya TaxID=1761012 RepID=A0A3G1KRQ4_FORW1|nr:GNAT family N-acetyltransferase [Candidatus Formimonas warabiya]ATW24815.1 hypothetical protein DCMF_08535 [Candidatus Formimonas warabiya]
MKVVDQRNMVIRRYAKKDYEEIMKLFYETVHYINCRDYSPAQLDAWAPKRENKERWKGSLENNYAIVAEMKGLIVGFGDLTNGGCFDKLFVHKDFQRQGIATAIAEEIEKHAFYAGLQEIHTEASITAQPFFLKRGYVVWREQQKPYQGEIFLNYFMKKQIRGEPENS